ncbi:MAG: peptidase M48 [Betaproteobacteria bacterium RBG_19FT_COMBO_58_11]|nr:MAG: peptidase M48 [Betaproteobacteria bacterium RBG_19FT_COMBO_58_11]
MQTFTLIFIFALALATALQLWLARRHIAHILTHKTQVPAAFSDKIGLAAHQKAADYTVAKTRLSFMHIALDTVVLLAFTLGGGIEWLTQAWQGVFDSPLLEGAALLLSTLILMSALEIPLSLYRTFGLEARFGFNKMTLGLFVLDLVKQAALGLALGMPLVLGVLWLMGAMGEYWWLYVWLAWVSFNLLIIAVYPAFIAPLFNKFMPLEDTALKSRIEALLQKCGFHASGLFVMDGSKRSAHGNAYFSGFGKTKRIVFFDTLLKNLSGDEIEAVLAHELGHFKRRHIVKRMAWLFTASLAGLWVLAYLMQASWFYAGLGVTTQTPATALLLFMLVSPVFTFLLHPLSARLSRKHEFEADQYAAQTSSATALIKALVKMYEDNASTLTPDPLHSAFYDSHPPAGIRIARLQAAS